MPPKRDYSVFIGKLFGRWLILDEKRISNKKGIPESYGFCRCSCSNKTERWVRFSDLLNGSSFSCGCYQKEKASESNIEENEYYLTDTGIGLLDNGMKFLFDLSDYEKIKEYKWHFHKTGYVCAFIRGCNNQKQPRLHRFILGLDENSNLVVDHANHNKLDNRKSNIRIATRKQNGQNSLLRKDNKTGYIGIYYDKRDGYYCGYIGNKSLGRSKILLDILLIRLMAEKKYFGEFAPQRHLFEEHGIGDD